jgi:hypothetical protein
MQFVISRSPVQVRALAPVESTIYGCPIFSSPSKTACICRTFADPVSRTAVETRCVPGTQYELTQSVTDMFAFLSSDET